MRGPPLRRLARRLIQLLAQIERKQAFHVGGIHQRAGKIAVVGIAPLVDGDRALIVRQRLGIFTRTAHDSAASGADVAERNIVVCRAELFFGLIEQRPGFLWLGALKGQPRFLNLDGRGQLFQLQMLGQLARGDDVLGGFLILALLAVGASFPEMRQHAQVLASQFALCRQYKAEEIDRTIRILVRHGGECLGHANHQEIAQRHLRPAFGRELLQQIVHELRRLVAQIHPLRQTQQERALAPHPMRLT